MKTFQQHSKYCDLYVNKYQVQATLTGTPRRNYTTEGPSRQATGLMEYNGCLMGVPRAPAGPSAAITRVRYDRLSEATDGNTAYVLLLHVGPAYGYLLYILVPYINTIPPPPYHQHTTNIPYHYHHTTTTIMLPPYHYQHGTTIPLPPTSGSGCPRVPTYYHQHGTT